MLELLCTRVVVIGRKGRRMIEIDPTEITPEHLFVNRRRFIKGSGGALATAALAACVPMDEPTPTVTQPGPTAPSLPEATPDLRTPVAGAETDDLGDKLTPYGSVIDYVNYYEFSLQKQGVGALTTDFRTFPWQVEVGGLVAKPQVFDMDSLLALGQEERIYRMRCVEGWSMVIPWIGFPLHKVLDLVEPTADAQYVRFETVHAPEQMPGQRGGSWDWPYVEGLRLDEAMHDLTLMATGLYGKSLTAQNGVPIRLVVPWKYGFKSIKSVVKIDLVAEMPVSFWMALSPNEYGFYSNVNPDVPHPRWSQATERRIGVGGRRPTLLFNGYEEEVASLYEGLDLNANY